MHDIFVFFLILAVGIFIGAWVTAAIGVRLEFRDELYNKPPAYYFAPPPPVAPMYAPDPYVDWINTTTSIDEASKIASQHDYQN